MAREVAACSNTDFLIIVIGNKTYVTIGNETYFTICNKTYVTLNKLPHPHKVTRQTLK